MIRPGALPVAVIRYFETGSSAGVFSSPEPFSPLVTPEPFFLTAPFPYFNASCSLRERSSMVNGFWMKPVQPRLMISRA